MCVLEGGVRGRGELCGCVRVWRGVYGCGCGCEEIGRK